MNFTRLILITCLAGLIPSVSAQGVKGRLTDVSNNPVPFAAVYDESTYAGTTSNADGYYELRLSQGKHSLVFKSLGYFLERRSVEINAGYTTLNLILKEQAYELKDVIVTPGKEDPAYAIMRKVISRAPYHQNQVKEYDADVYLRGSINIIRMPKIISKNIEINGKKGVIKSGDVYIEESVNLINFKAPDKYEQKVKSFRTTFPGENTVSPMQIVRASFYQPTIGEAISPLASNAFSYYKY
ncbi:MAG: carboxypeptidase-like regulatory domain-containing protein, partial [Bacteroidales bacterium]|nr:carboxypeptidase-like regulatory domain-containing protein [Bacteroidales bacterium]